MTETDLNRIRWRCRRGLLENDIFIERFFTRHGAKLTQAQASALLELMALSDNDLLDLLLQRKVLAQVAPQYDDATTQDVLRLLQER